MAKYSRNDWLASIYYSSKKSSTKSFFVSITCQLSSVQSCTRKPIRYSPREKRNEDELKKKKTVYAIRTQCKSQNCGISYITLYVHHVTRKKKYIVDQFGVHLSVPVSSHCSPESVAGGPCLLRPRAPSAWQCRRRRTVCCNQKCSLDEDRCVIR